MQGNADAVLALLLDWIAKGFVVLGFSFLADLLLRRANAALRHLNWLAGLTALLLLPVISWMMPAFDVPLFRLGFLVTASAREASSAQAGSGAGIGWSATEIALGLYACGALLVFAWQLAGRFYVCRLRNRAGKVVDDGIVREFRRLMTVLEIRQPVALLSSELISMPFSAGYFCPAIVLPRATTSWPPQVLETVLVHELAHIRRKDILVRIAAQISCCVHWINPLAWYGLGRVMMEQEIACDNFVLEKGTKASDYARNLLALSEMRRGRMDFALTAFGRRTELKSRLLEILRPTRNRTPLRIGGALAFLLLALGLLLPVSALNVWDRPEARPMTASPAAVIVSRPASSQPGGDLLSPQRPLPEVADVKKKIAQKIMDMKAAGLPEEEIAKFTVEAKLKIEALQRQRMKQSEDKKKQMELMMSNQGKY